MKTITVKIKAPPRGWKYANRIPKWQTEEYQFFEGKSWSGACNDKGAYGIRKRDYIGGIYAYRIKKGKK